jgi:fluoride exporter
MVEPGPQGHPRLLPLLLVVLGGGIGAGCREAVSLALPPVDGVPIAIVVVNTIGALALGLLTEAVTRPTIPESRRASLKLLLGTGFCGGFTTYSSLAVDTAVLSSDGHHGQAILYAGATLIVGLCATFAGMALGVRIAAGSEVGTNP